MGWASIKRSDVLSKHSVWTGQKEERMRWVPRSTSGRGTYIHWLLCVTSLIGSFCRYRKALYFWSLGISLYLELFCFLSFITIVLRNLCFGTHRRNRLIAGRYSSICFHWNQQLRKVLPKSNQFELFKPQGHQMTVFWKVFVWRSKYFLEFSNP